MNYEDAYKELFKQWRHLNNKVNKVTAYYRHGNFPTKKIMVDLCNTQITVEHAITTIEATTIENSCKKCGAAMNNICLGCLHDG